MKDIKEKIKDILINEFNYGKEQIEDFNLQAKDVDNSIILVWDNLTKKILNKSPLIVVECRKEETKIDIDLYNYGYSTAVKFKSKFFVAANNKQIKCFTVKNTYKIKNEFEILNIPTQDELENTNQKYKSYNNYSKDKILLSLLKCLNILRNNDLLPLEDAFNEMCKVLFIKYFYEFKNKGIKILDLDNYLIDELGFDIENDITENDSEKSQYLQYLFSEVKKYFKDYNLFESNSVIKIRSSSFRTTIDELSYFNMNKIPDEIRGYIFNQLIFRVYGSEFENNITPHNIVDFMINILNPKEGEIILNSSCGYGDFLVSSYNYIKKNIIKNIDYNKNIFRNSIELDNNDSIIKNVIGQLNYELEDLGGKFKEKYSRIYLLSNKYLFGLEDNSKKIRLSKMNMIMHGSTCNNIFDISQKNEIKNMYDVIFSNPIVTNNNYITFKSDENEFKYIESNKNKKIFDIRNYEISDLTSAKELLEFDKCLNMLKPGGRLGIILPDKFLKGEKYNYIREYFESKCKIMYICSLPKDAFLEIGYNMLTSILFVQKFTDHQNKEYEMALQKIKFISNRQNELDFSSEDEKYKIFSKENNDEKKLVSLLKSEIDYSILATKIVDVDDFKLLGIENDFDIALKDFKKYIKNMPLWKEKNIKYTYNLNDDLIIQRQQINKNSKANEDYE